MIIQFACLNIGMMAHLCNVLITYRCSQAHIQGPWTRAYRTIEFLFLVHVKCPEL